YPNPRAPRKAAAAARRGLRAASSFAEFARPHWAAQAQRSSRLVRVACAAVLLATLIAVRAHAQEDAPEKADRLRTTIDDDLQDRPAEPIKPKRTAPRDSRPSGSGAGQTGYLSTNLPRSKSKAGVKSGRAASAAGRVSAPPKPGARAAQGKAAATPPGKAPVVNPKAAAVGTQ